MRKVKQEIWWQKYEHYHSLYESTSSIKLTRDLCTSDPCRYWISCVNDTGSRTYARTLQTPSHAVLSANLPKGMAKQHIMPPIVPLETVPSFICWHLDFVGELPTTIRGNKRLLVAVDSATNWLIARALPEATGEAIARFVYEEIAMRFGHQTTNVPRLSTQEPTASVSGWMVFSNKCCASTVLVPSIDEMTS
jgi:hypothetical protein